MIARYTRRELGEIWSDHARFEAMRQVEVAACEEMEGVSPVELAAIRGGTERPINVNFFCHLPPEPDAQQEAEWRALLAPYYEEFGIDAGSVSAGAARRPFSEEAADVLEEFRPEVVSFHFGLPSDRLMTRVRAMGAKIIGCATTLEEALWLEDRGVDAVHHPADIAGTAAMRTALFMFRPGAETVRVRVSSQCVRGIRGTRLLPALRYQYRTRGYGP